MSTAKVINVQHPSASTTNNVNDASGNVTIGNNLTVTGTTSSTGSFSAPSLTTSGNLSVAGTSTLTGNVTAGGTVAMASSFKRNRIINGNMLVWQRGTTGFATNNAYCADRWLAKADTTFTSASQSTDAPSGFKYSLSVSGTGYAGALQRIEALNCTDLSGQTVTISFWAKQASGAGTNSLTVAIYYPNSADNYAGGVTQIGANQYATGSSSWARYSFMFTGLPSGVLNGLNPYILSNVAGASTILITGVQIEVGTVATPYEMQIYSDQLAQCQRYYFNQGQQLYNSFYALGSIGYTQLGRTYPVTMRATPTITLLNTAYSAWSFSTVIASLNDFALSGTASGGNGYIAYNFTASAEL